MTSWRWKNFTKKEIACKQISKRGNCGCGGSIVINEDGLDKLQALREIVGVPFTPNSAYRCPIHNRNVGGATNSMHPTGGAYDIPISARLTREMIHAAAKKVGFNGIGDYANFVHVDNRKKPAYWDER